MYTIELRSKAQRGLDAIKGRDFQAIIAAIRRLEQNPRRRGVEKVKPAGLWRIRQGDYRIVYDIDDKNKVVTVVRIGHRREVYRSI